ncbi:MAG: tol-pal system protein YbgF [Hyphomicrobiaceae bacterium]|nr:tol-pal system protein YbgF [Hyphomicrobiaceae bacterium]
MYLPIVAGVALACLAAVPAHAQQQPAAKPAGAGSTAALEKRVEQLAEQIVDMQVVMGTLESLARQGAPSAPAAAPAYAAAPGASGVGAADSARVEGMETQIQALTAQIELLTRQVRELSSGGQRGDAGRPAGADTYAAAPSFDEPPSRSDAGGFGATIVRPGTDASGSDERDGIGGFLSRQPGEPGSYDREDLAALPGADGNNPKQVFETAYGYLLQQDYPAAEEAFGDFLQRFPKDRLAGSAQFWLGEAHYMRGEYKAAAGAFLKGYQSYTTSQKAPDSLLKLAMSLDRLGQKDAACSSFAELGTRFPNAPPHVKNRAASERRRVGC